MIHKQTGNDSAQGLSIVVLHYNRPWSLEIAVDSLNQMRSACGFPVEIILADDGSDAELIPFFGKLPLDHVHVQAQHIAEDKRASVYYTLLAGFQAARYDHILYVEDDFWFIPQGFVDRGKSHRNGLVANPDFSHTQNPIQGGVELLGSLPEAHFVELARGFTNPRYLSLPTSECVRAGVRFRAKKHVRKDRWYICAWPHILRTREAISTPLPLGEPLWRGESVMSKTRREVFGPGNWVYNPEYCYFVHMNIFTWREAMKQESQADANGNFRWMEMDGDARLPHQFKAIPNFNQRLLEAFKRGEISNDLDAYHSSSPLEYAYQQHYKRVCNDL